MSVFAVVSLAACSTEKEVDTSSLDLTVEVSGACGQAGCELSALDDAQLYVMSWQLFAQQVDGVAQIYTCGEEQQAPTMASLQATLRKTDGGVRAGPFAVGRLGGEVPFEPARQVGTGEAFQLELDGGLHSIAADFTVVDRTASSLTVRYTAPELPLTDGGRRLVPGLDIVERYEWATGRQRVNHRYDSICSVSPPTGFY